MSKHTRQSKQPGRKYRISAKRRRYLSNRAKRQNRDNQGRFVKGFKETQQHPGSNYIPLYSTSSPYRPKPTRKDSLWFNFKRKLVKLVIDNRITNKRKKNEVTDTVARNFSTEEILAIDDYGRPIVISDEKMLKKISEEVGVRIDGCCKHKRKPDGHTLINLSKTTDETAITHEFIHHLRAVDKTREGYSQSAHTFDDKGVKMHESKPQEVHLAEESAAHAESALRVAYPMDKKHVPGPYSNKCDECPEKNAFESYERDRATMRQINGKPIADGITVTGEKAKQLLNENYPKTELSNKELGGNTAKQIMKKLIEKRANRRPPE